MRILIGALAVALLAGCTTPSDLMAGKPALTVITTKAPKAFALCVYPAWQDYRSGAVFSETENGYRIVAGSGMNAQTDDVLDIEKAKTGSIAKLYQRAAWSQIGRDGIRDALNRCL
jgi:hypothetical protein